MKITLLVATLTIVLLTSVQAAETIEWVQCSDGTIVRTNVNCGDYKGGILPN